MAPRRVGRYLLALGTVVICVLRLAYVRWEPVSNAFFSSPSLDAGYYVDWAGRIARGETYPGAFYLAPLYAYFLSGVFVFAGDNLLVVATIQQILGVVSAGLFGFVALRVSGRAAGFFTFVLAATYHPMVFFAARPMGEALSVFLLALALSLAVCGYGLLGGISLGLGALARPNLLLAPVFWAAWDWLGSRRRLAILLIAGVVATVLPVTLRNWIASGHPVPVSSNGGLTLYHGNGPGSLGIFSPPDGFSGQLSEQRAEATALARVRSGANLDDVEADGWWGRQAVRERIFHPGDSAILFYRKLLLTFDSYEHGLDEAPAMDQNPWRLTFHRGGPSVERRGELPLISFGLLLGLSVSGVVLRGWGGTGGGRIWLTVAACAVTPLAFYVSSRYRLPLAGVLTIPAGAGAAALFAAAPETGWRRRLVAAAAGAVTLGISLFMPFGELRAAEESGALANQASAWKHRGVLDRAQALAEAAVVRDPRSTAARYTLGVVLSAAGRASEAEAQYRSTLDLDPGHAESAANLASLLIGSSRPREAIPILRAALAVRPTDDPCWTNLVVAYAQAGDVGAARAAAADATRAGVRLEPGLLQAIGLQPPPAGGS